MGAEFEMKEYVTVEFLAGFGSTAFYGGDRFRPDLCQRCVKALLGPLLRCDPDRYGTRPSHKLNRYCLIWQSSGLVISSRHWRCVQTPRFDYEKQLRRAEALEAAERSGIRAGLPLVSDFARTIAKRWAAGELPVNRAISLIVKHHEMLGLRR